MDKGKEWLERWGAMLAIVATVGGGSWLVATAIGNVRTDLTEQIHSVELRMETRLSAMEGKLDILIDGLNIQVARKPGGGL